MPEPRDYIDLRYLDIGAEAVKQDKQQGVKSEPRVLSGLSHFGV